MGHSYGGAVITEAGNDPKVVGLGRVHGGHLLIPWALISMGEKKANCTVCGARYKRHPFESV